MAERFDIHDEKSFYLAGIRDLSGKIEDMNYVIYNPSKDAPHERINKLYERVKERFNVELTSDELDRLTKYDTYQLSEFVTDLQRIIRNKK